MESRIWIRIRIAIKTMPIPKHWLLEKTISENSRRPLSFYPHQARVQYIMVVLHYYKYSRPYIQHYFSNNRTDKHPISNISYVVHHCRIKICFWREMCRRTKPSISPIICIAMQIKNEKRITFQKPAWESRRLEMAVPRAWAKISTELKISTSSTSRKNSITTGICQEEAMYSYSIQVTARGRICIRTIQAHPFLMSLNFQRKIKYIRSFYLLLGKH